MAKLSSIQKMGENFLAVIENWKKQKQDKEEFEKKMQYYHRQQTLINTRFNVEQDRLKSQFEERMKIDAINSGFTPVPEGQVPEDQWGYVEGLPTGGLHKGLPPSGIQQKTTPPTVKFGEGTYTFPVPEAPEAPKPKVYTDYTLEPDPESESGYTVKYHKGLKPKTTTKTDKPPKTPVGSSLKQFEINALSSLEQPILTVEVKGVDEDGQKFTRQAPMNPSEAKRYLFDNWNVVANAHLKSNEALGWLKRYVKKRGWIPSTVEITNAVNDDKDLSDVAVNQLVNYLEVHRGMYPGLIKIQQTAGMLPK